MIKRFLIVVFLLALVLPVQAQTEPVVFGVFFYSPTCSHCHKVITEDWPGIQAEFGNQLQVLFINVNSYDGLAVMSSARDAGLLTDEQQGVPMLLIGDYVLIGDLDIPARTPGIVRDGLAAGGIDLPPIPGIQEMYDQAVAASQAQATAVATAEATAVIEAANSLTGNPALPLPDETPTLSERLAADPIANALAIGVLVALAFSLGAVALAVTQQASGTVGSWLNSASHWATLIALLVAAGLILTVALGNTGEVGEALLAATTALLLLLGVVAVGRGREESGGLLYGVSWLVPVILVAGVIVAGYLTYVEVTANTAVCGIVGDCNAVQQSAYARLFGVLPVGVVGLVGYFGLLLVWIWGKVTGSRYATLFLLGMALVGVIFSLYLTYLEPFVIGATCVWCLTSAVIMIALLWLFLPDGVIALASGQGSAPQSGKPATTHV
ncbi:MAG: vitamin K epoxide reductase family protein [Anaerolineaceae bacterium]|nr:vitamin K epoxide reductase family protein [Anaerolineaceae bacterium]